MASMRIPASQVPLAVRRRAAQHLESVRETEMGVNARRARLTDEVGTILRPDLPDIAYYEFEVALGNPAARVRRPRASSSSRPARTTIPSPTGASTWSR